MNWFKRLRRLCVFNPPKQGQKGSDGDSLDMATSFHSNESGVSPGGSGEADGTLQRTGDRIGGVPETSTSHVDNSDTRKVPDTGAEKTLGGVFGGKGGMSKTVEEGWLDRPWCSNLKTPKVNHYSSREGYKIEHIWIHYTAGSSVTSSIRWARNPEAKAAAHNYVGRRGDIFQVVSYKYRAWHGGAAKLLVDGSLVSKPDRAGIGIEIANHGLLEKDGNDFYYVLGRTLKPYRGPRPEFATLKYSNGHEVAGYWEPYTDETVKAVVKLCSALVTEYNIPLTNIIGHNDAAIPVGRKIDPGPLWPWKHFMESLSSDLNKPLPDDVWSLHKTEV